MTRRFATQQGEWIPSENRISIPELAHTNPSVVSFTAPEDLPSRETTHPLTNHSYKLGCFKIERAVLVGGHAIVVTSDHKVLSEQNAGTLINESYNAFSAPLYWSVPELTRAVSLCAAPSYNFYHWMLDSLPKVIVAEECGFDGTYVVPGTRVSSFIHTTLQLVGIPPSRILHMEYPRVTVRELWVPTFFDGMRFGEAPELLHRFRRTIIDAIGTVSFPALPRLFVTRLPGSASRCVINYNDVCRTASRFGFTSVAMENIPLSLQIWLGCNARSFAGVHGAGMTHITWMSPGSSVLELFSPHAMNPCYEMVSKALGHHYRSLTFAAGTPDGLFVDCDRLAVELEKLADEERSLAWSF